MSGQGSLRRIGALVLSVAGGLLASAGCGSNGSSGGPPGVPCGQEPSAPAPICGEACHVKCGCRTCNDGDTLDKLGASYVCTSGCFKYVGPSDGGLGGSGGTGGGGTGGTSGTDGGGGSVNCNNVDCAQNPPICSACTTCGCCSCDNGNLINVSGNLYVCSNNCYSPLVDAGDGG